METLAYSAVGAKNQLIRFELKAGQHKQMRFADEGIPEDARILDINYTPQGDSVFPVEMHGNRPHRHIPHLIDLYGIPIGVDLPDLPDPVSVMASVIWLCHAKDDESRRSLIDAFHFYGFGKYQETIVPANVAVESRITVLLDSVLRVVASGERVKDFLSKGATYSHQLNVILPLLAKLTNLPGLDENIRGQLNRLRDARNDIAHRGKPDKILDKASAAEMLCAALFGFEYMEFVSPLLKARFGVA